METLISFVIAAAVTFFFVRRYLEGLTAPNRAMARSFVAVPVEAKMHPCPRCGKPIPQAASFCLECGAPLSLWKVHRAAIQVSGGERARSKPKPVIDTSVCMGCGACARACPIDCIEMDAVRHGKELEWISFTLDYQKCMFCELCVYPCPKDCIHMGTEFAFVSYDRSEFVHDLLSYKGMSRDAKQRMLEAEGKRRGPVPPPPMSQREAMKRAKGNKEERRKADVRKADFRRIPMSDAGMQGADVAAHVGHDPAERAERERRVVGLARPGFTPRHAWRGQDGNRRERRLRSPCGATTSDSNGFALRR